MQNEKVLEKLAVVSRTTVANSKEATINFIHSIGVFNAVELHLQGKCPQSSQFPTNDSLSTTILVSENTKIEQLKEQL